MILVDTADHASIEKALAHPFVSGVTTNPNLVVHPSEAPVSLDDYLSRVDALCRLPLGVKQGRFSHLMVQVAGPLVTWPAQMARFANGVAGWNGGTLWIKLPPTLSGLAACSEVRRVGACPLITAVFTPSQALAALDAGADGIAVYYRRLQEAVPDAERRLRRMAELIGRREKLLLLASISTVELLHAALAFGDDVTVSPSVVDQILEDDASRLALDSFEGRVMPTATR